MLNGVMLLWFVLMAMALGFVAIDIRKAPVSPVMKWGFVLLTVYTGASRRRIAWMTSISVAVFALALAFVAQAEAY